MQRNGINWTLAVLVILLLVALFVLGIRYFIMGRFLKDTSCCLFLMLFELREYLLSKKREAYFDKRKWRENLTPIAGSTGMLLIYRQEYWYAYIDLLIARSDASVNAATPVSPYTQVTSHSLQYYDEMMDKLRDEIAKVDSQLIEQLPQISVHKISNYTLKMLVALCQQDDTSSMAYLKGATNEIRKL